MKNILYLLLFIPFTFFGQSFLSIEQDIPLELSEGWNMFGYSCFESMDVIEAFEPVVDKVIIVKDYSGAVYMTEFGFNGIGNLQYNRGYQIKTTQAISDFQFCPAIVPLIEGCMDATAFNYNGAAHSDDGSCYPVVLGCLDPTAFNFNDYDYDGQANYFTGLNGIDINTDDGSCVEVVYGCTGADHCYYNPEANTDDGSCIYPELGYDCEGNIVPQYQVGDLAEGGIIFQINEDGTGLVAAMEDLTEGATDPYGWGFNGYEWGCYQQEVNGADGTAIGTGLQNTMDIINQGCSTENGGITAAQAALDAEINGYSDWFLPSIDELVEMYNTIGNGGPEGNIGGFETSDWPYYWSSSEPGNSDAAWGVYFGNGYSGYHNKTNTYRVRVIRAF